MLFVLIIQQMENILKNVYMGIFASFRHVLNVWKHDRHWDYIYPGTSFSITCVLCTIIKHNHGNTSPRFGPLDLEWTQSKRYIWVVVIGPWHTGPFKPIVTNVIPLHRMIDMGGIWLWINKRTPKWLKVKWNNCHLPVSYCVQSVMNIPFYHRLFVPLLCTPLLHSSIQLWFSIYLLSSIQFPWSCTYSDTDKCLS